MIRVEKREFAWEFSQLSCPSQTRTRVARELMRVEKREFAWEFPQLSCPGQTRTRVAWELRSESVHESFHNSHAPVKREQELNASWEARVCMRVFTTLMSQSNENKSCMRVEKREFAWEFSQLSCPSQTRTRVAWELRSESLHESFHNSHAPVKREQELHESWLDITMHERSENSHQNLNQFTVDESWRSNASETCNSHARFAEACISMVVNWFNSLWHFTM
jgi:hypothetical protein